MNHSLRLLAASLLALLTWLSVGPAEAQPSQVPRAIVLRFEGWRAERARQAVVTELASFVELVDEEQAVDAAQALGVDVSTPDGMAQVVENLGITLVVTGSVDGRGRRATTTIVVVDPRGNELSRRDGPSPRRRRDLPDIAQAALDAVNEAQQVLDQQRQAAMQPEPEPEPDPMAYEPPPQEEPEPEVAWRQPMILAMGGLRVRSVSTTVRDASFRQHFFAADPYPEIDLRLDARPLAERSDELRGLLFAAEGSFSVGINYVGGDGQVRGMTSMHFRVDAGYGYTIEDILEIGGTLGIGLDGVFLDDPDGFPSQLWTYFRPGVFARVRAYEELVMVEGGLGGRVGIDGGDVAPAFGPGMFFGGVDLYLGLAGILAEGLTWSARFGYSWQELSFDGAGGAFGNGQSGLDETFEGRFLVGYAYR